MIKLDEKMKGLISRMVPSGAPIADNEDEIDYSFAMEYQGPPVTYDLPRAVPIDIKRIPTASVVTQSYLSDKMLLPVVQPLLIPDSVSKDQLKETVLVSECVIVSPTSVIPFEQRVRNGNECGVSSEFSSLGTSRFSNGLDQSCELSDVVDSLGGLGFRDGQECSGELSHTGSSSDRLGTSNGKGHECSSVLGFSDGHECSGEFNEASLLALLNLAVKDEKNKVKIVDAGALEPLICFLRSDNTTLREYATAALLTLSASAINKPTISSFGVIPLLVEILRDGSPQAKVDSVMTLYNLSTRKENLTVILSEKAISPLVNLLKSCKKSSKTTEKCSALIESLLDFEEGRYALTTEEGGVLAVVEVLENGSPQSRECAVGALLKMCESDRDRYREPILKEGVIPGLLEMTVQGTPRSQLKAHTLLQLLRDSPYPRSELEADTLENIVCDIVSQIDGEDRGGKAKKMLAEMVQVSMEQSLRHLQQRALVCTTD